VLFCCFGEEVCGAYERVLAGAGFAGWLAAWCVQAVPRWSFTTMTVAPA